MKRYFLILFCAIVPMIASAATATTGTCTITTSASDQVPRWILFTWTSSVAGNVIIQTDNAIRGEICRIVTDPGATAPSDNYDIYFSDVDSIDVLSSATINRDTANTEQVVPSLTGSGTNTDFLPVVSSRMTFTVNNAGASKQGTCRIYWR